MHKDHRDKFEVIAFHETSAKDFAQLDKELEQVKQQHWHGKDLPFPILLDSTGETIKTYGPTGYPTTILIDPEGTLVGEASAKTLEEKLPPIPMSVRIARALDRGIYLLINDVPLQMVIEQILPSQAQIPLRVDADAAKQAGVSLDTMIKVSLNTEVSLQSALNLLLEPHGLTYEVRDEGIVVVPAKSGARTAEPPSEPQKFAAARIERALAEKKLSFDFKDKPLQEVLEVFAESTGESFLLDLAARTAGKLDPRQAVSGTANDLPARQALAEVLKSVGLSFAVCHEVVVILPAAAPQSAKPSSSTEKQ